MIKSNNDLTIDHSWQGQALIDAGGKFYVAAHIDISVWPQWGIVQAGLPGRKWIPEKQLGIDESYRFSAGDYDVTVTRRKSKDRKGDPKIISLSAERAKRKQKVSV